MIKFKRMRFMMAVSKETVSKGSVEPNVVRRQLEHSNRCGVLSVYTLRRS